ncbi:MAG: 4-(cytidine 5'-diphospho)-2-C-methyl-D-erythritol kinase [Spirochaetaceae bacterium]|nr:4-(cytidine 5'-diphospho)-2-C-methyl-D-erythritol kinase [Spirochaetaceae bacterium]
MNPVRSVEIAAPCKINVHLRVKSRRADGYHSLESVFLALGFGDTLRFEVEGEPGACEIIMEGAALRSAGLFSEEALSAENNIVLKTAALFRERSGFAGGLRVRIEKRIPMRAGLGGGSSDAGAALKALNRLSGGALRREELLEMALILGSDVPFFLYGGAAWVRGRGEDITPIAVPEGLAVVLAHPGFPSGTREAFRLLDEARAYAGDVCADTPCPVGDLAGHPRDWRYWNDFLPVLLSAGPPAEAEAYRAVLAALREGGADFAGLSGSGSVCFGVFTDETAARETVRRIRGNEGRNFAELTFPLARFDEAGIE